MQPGAIVGVCLGSLVVALLAFMAHHRLARGRERAGLLSMLAYVLGVVAVLTALITGGFLLSLLFSG
jgi:hypothetical protein